MLIKAVIYEVGSPPLGLQIQTTFPNYPYPHSYAHSSVVLLSRSRNLECVTAQWFRETSVSRIAYNLVVWGARDMELNIFKPKPSEVSEQ